MKNLKWHIFHFVRFWKRRKKNKQRALFIFYFFKYHWWLRGTSFYGGVFFIRKLPRLFLFFFLIWTRFPSLGTEGVKERGRYRSLGRFVRPPAFGLLSPPPCLGEHFHAHADVTSRGFTSPVERQPSSFGRLEKFEGGLCLY